MKKTFSLLAILFLLNGCAETLALLGPATSMSAGSGKIAQSAVSSVVSYGVKKQTGMTPSQHALSYVQKHNPQNTKEKCIEFIKITNSETCAAVKKNIIETKKKIVEARNKILSNSKIEDLAKKSNLIRR
jgi:hypothetical protein